MIRRAIIEKVRGRMPYLLAVAAILFLDRLSKVAVQRALTPGGARQTVSGFFDLVHFQNPGIAFGVFSEGDSTAKVVLLSGFALVAVVAVLVYSLRSPVTDRLLQSGLALILAGALGNLYDRLSYGYVIDFLYFHAGEYYWPAFNLADSAITVGVACLLVVVVQDEIRARS